MFPYMSIFTKYIQNEEFKKRKAVKKWAAH